MSGASVALLRYVGSDAARTQRWAAPLLVFLAATAAFDSPGGTALSCYAFSSAVLLPTAMWLTVGICNSEDPVQTAITVATVGSALRVRLAKLGLAYLACLLLTVLAVAWPVLSHHPAGTGAVAAGAVAHLLDALAGVAFGALLSRPVLDRLGWAMAAGVAVCLVEFLVPAAPPARQLLTLLGGDPAGGRLGVGLAAIAAETVALSVGAGTLSHRLAITRT